MAYNEKLANRIREALVETANVEEKKMFRGLTFMVNDKMCISVADDELMCRIDPSQHDTILEKNGCREMIHGGRTIKGFVYVPEDAVKTKKELDYWIKLSLSYNEKAKSSKKKVKNKSYK